jgi:hypothetical protein
MRKEKLFEKIGQMTVLFATLEHQLQLLLEILLGETTQLIGPFFIHELNLAVLLRKIKHIARFKMQGNASLLDELEHVLKQIEATRDTRNLLVHGYWQIEEERADCPVRVSDFKMKFEEGQWQELTDTTFNEKKLTHLVRRLEAMSHDVTHITRRLRGVQSPAKALPQTG